MIGSFPIGVVSIGSNYQPGPKVESLGIADATAEGLLLGLLTNPTLGVSSASATGLNVVTLSKPALVSALGEANANSVLLSISQLLESAGGTATALSIGGQKIGLLVADNTAKGEDAQFLVYLDLGKGTGTAEAKPVIPKQLSTMIFAHAIASGELIENLQIRMKIGRAESDAIGLDAVPLSKLQLSQAFAESTGINFSGIGLGLFRVDLNTASTITGLGISLDDVNATAQALGITPLAKPILDNAEAIAQALGVTEQDLILTIEDATAQALNGDITYIVGEVPEIVVTRTSTQAILKVLNQNQNNLRIFRSDDHRGNFSVLESNWDDSTDYTDTGLDETKNYKYVASFVVVGEKGGVEYIVTGQKCLPVYTIGNQLL